jgi:hypothetical protein
VELNRIFEQLYARNYGCRVPEALVDQLRHDHPVNLSLPPDRVRDPSHIARQLADCAVSGSCALQFEHIEVAAVIDRKDIYGADGGGVLDAFAPSRVNVELEARTSDPD